jgi:hypothetical protein
MTYACAVWEFAAESHLLKLQWLQNKVLRTIGNFPGRTPDCNMHVAFQIHAGNKQKSSKIMKMKMLATLDKVKPDTNSIRGLNLAAVMCKAVQVSRLIVV